MDIMVVSKTSHGLAVNAPAKLNLYLEVLGKRDDGFHELETLMTPVRLHDSLSWTPTAVDTTGSGPTLLIDAASPAMPGESKLGESTPRGEDNLVLRAARRLAHAAGVEPHGQFSLTKRIPLQAGMGGGSSDAAATLLLANQAWGVHYPRERLIELAATLGSDVPFFLMDSPAVCRGRGEIMDAVAGLPRLHLVAIKPAASVSTPQAFTQLNAGAVAKPLQQRSRSRLNSLIVELQRGNLSAAAKWMTNCFQQIQVARSKALETLQQALARCGAVHWQMTGSGSAFFACFRTAVEARCVAARLRVGTHGLVWTTSTC